ncbi:MAG: DEAD/DEAH box helicase [Euryarchaeota archaeon]|nr:DEAD/DEAH box helicase [Euryarchaeota archaeon]
MVYRHLDKRIQKLLEKRDWKTPTKPQEMGSPKILEGKNVLIIAETGSGKTEAAFLPVLSNVLRMKEDGIKALYIAPLRALNRDLLRRLEWWCKHLDLKIEVRHGDTTQYQRRQQALSPPDILITTPETLQAIMVGKVMRKHLEKVKYVIVDEIHELATEKRGFQLSIGLERLAKRAGEFVRVGLSATVGSPKEVGKFLAGNRPHEIINTAGTKETELSILFPLPSDEDREMAETLEIGPETMARLRTIEKLMEKHRGVLTFVNTRDTAEILSSRFNLMNVSMDVHHSSLSKEMRIETEKEFKSEKLKSLICTSSMELGIDVGSVDLVIQYMSPRQVSRLVQRVGRSGHSVERQSNGIIIVNDEDDILESMVIVRKTLSGELEKTDIQRNALDVLAHQVTGLAMEYYKMDIDVAHNIITGAYPYRDITRKKLEEIIEIMCYIGILWRDGEIFGRKRAAFQYYFGNLSMIPDTKQYTIIDIGSGSRIGVLDEEFIETRAETGGIFTVKGRAWEILEIKEGKVLVSQAENIGAVPGWEGENIPVPFEIAQEVGSLRDDIFQNGRLDRYIADENSLEKIQKYIENQGKRRLATDNRVVIETYENYLILHACFGTIVNETLSTVLSSILSSKFGSSIAVRSDPYRICFKFPIKADDEGFKKILTNLKQEQVRPILELTLKRSSLFQWKLAQVAKRFGALTKEAEGYHLRKIMYTFQDSPLYEETFRELFNEKLDVKTTEDVLQRIGSEEYEIAMTSSKEPSPFAYPILTKMGASGIMTPKRPLKEILKLLKKRLENRRVKLFCVYCGNWYTTVKIKNMEEHPQCRNCQARFLAILRKNDRKTMKALKKRLKKQEITKEEDELVVYAKRTADLMLVYGKKAALALAARGIGPQTASRILARMHRDEEEFLKSILDAEKQYVRTRRYWD